MCLERYGFNSAFASSFNDIAPEGFTAARVISENRGGYRLITAHGEADAVLPGRLRHHAEGADELPAVGDWIVIQPRSSPDEIAVVHAVLPRRTKISRKVAGARSDEQIVASNVDVVFLMMGLDGDWNPRRLERFLVMVWESGARPVVILNKADLLDEEELDARRTEIDLVAPGVPVCIISCAEDHGLDGVRTFLREGETIALLGSSGVGKSTLTNHLLGHELMTTSAVREGDDRGRHTTTRRQLIQLPGGALLIDNPGIRELQLWSEEGALDTAFEDVEAAATQCRFQDCTHNGEPGCGVAEAVRVGTLSSERLASYQGLEREVQALERRRDEKSRRAHERQFGRMTRSAIAEKKRTRR
jgi:ribosome biogenesis GTPase